MSIAFTSPASTCGTIGELALTYFITDTASRNARLDWADGVRWSPVGDIMYKYRHEIGSVGEGLEAHQRRPAVRALENDRPERVNARAPLPAVSIGVVLRLEADGRHLVEFTVAGVVQRAPARILDAVSRVVVGQKVALAFEDADPGRPIVLGSLRETTTPSEAPDSRGDPVPVHANASVDDRKIVFTAEEEIVLTCGKASITLTRAGKVIIRGEYLVSRSTGVNAIKGGVVRIN